jgi:hypothetical protein
MNEIYAKLNKKRIGFINRCGVLQLRRTCLASGLFLVSAICATAQDNAVRLKKRPGTNIGLIYPLSSNWKQAALDTNNFSLNLLAGLSAAERGVSFAGITNVIRNDASGFQVAGFSNHIGKNADGVIVAGFTNTYGGGRATAFSGFANISGRGTGSQFAGFLNKAGAVKGVQVSGFANIATGIEGAQISGFLNVAKKVKGLQLSVINIADTADNQIGILNISKNGEKALGVTIDENQTMMVTFRSGGRTFYGILGLGYNVDNKINTYAFEAGLGAHVFTFRSFRLNAEAVSGGLQSFKGGNYFKQSFRLMPAIKLTRSIELFGGPSLNFIATNSSEGKALTTNYISSWYRNNGRDLYASYIGYNAGLQISF